MYHGTYHWIHATHYIYVSTFIKLLQQNKMDDTELLSRAAKPWLLLISLLSELQLLVAPPCHIRVPLLHMLLRYKTIILPSFLLIHNNKKTNMAVMEG